MFFYVIIIEYTAHNSAGKKEQLLCTRCFAVRHRPERKWKSLKEKRIFIRLITLVITGVILACSALPVSAITPFEQIIKAEDEGDHSLNTSTVSDFKIFIGESFTLTASSDGLSPKKCTYAFYVRYNRKAWKTIREYSKQSTAEYTPDKTGQYEFCIKIRCSSKVYKRYYTCTVTRPVINESLLSSAFIQRGSSVEISARAQGGEGGFRYEYLMKKAGEDDWTVLCDYSETTSLQWTPRESGDYELCVNAQDIIGIVKEKYMSLNVSSDGRRYPAEFTVTVKAPIASPYLWSCSVSDDSIITYSQTTGSCSEDMLDPYVLLNYTFTPLSAGAADLVLSYGDCQGKPHELVYHIIVDKNLGYEVVSVTGSYFDKKLPQPQQIKRSFSISLSKPDPELRWSCELDSGYVVECDKASSGWSEDEYTFNTVRKGRATLTFVCEHPEETAPRYRLVYNIISDENRNASVSAADGYYVEGEELPELMTG